MGGATSFETDRGTLSYTRRGSGPLLVCIPGGPGMDPEAYFAATDLPGFEVLVFAPRGTGASTPPPSPDGYRITGYIADVESLRAHLGRESLTLYGHSHGGMVAMAYAATHPDRVSRFIVANGPARMDERYLDAVALARARFAETVPDGAARLAASTAAEQEIPAATSVHARRRAYRALMSRYVAREGPAESEYLDRLCDAPMNWDAADGMYAEMLGGLDLLEQAATVTAPALVVAGEFDVTVPPAAMRQIADTLAGARYVEFAGVGHFVEVEARDEFRRTVCAFLAE